MVVSPATRADLGRVRESLWWEIVVAFDGFVGAFENAIDEKGRIMLPIPFRSSASPRLTLMCRPDGAIAAYPAQRFDALFAEVADKVHRSQIPVLRRVLGSALEVPVDSTHRFIVPEFLRSYAKLVAPGKAVLIGTGDCFEVWERTAFATYGQSAFLANALTEEAARAGVPQLV